MITDTGKQFQKTDLKAKASSPFMLKVAAFNKPRPQPDAFLR